MVDKDGLLPLVISPKSDKISRLLPEVSRMGEVKRNPSIIIKTPINWYWTWTKDWPQSQPLPADWPDYILTSDPDGWEGNYPVAYWDERWKDIVIYGQGELRYSQWLRLLHLSLELL